jgi:hypothetical protein
MKGFSKEASTRRGDYLYKYLMISLVLVLSCIKPVNRG